MSILFKAYVPSTLGLHKLQMQQKMNLGARILKIKPLVKLTKLRYICPTPFQLSFRFEGSKLRYICLNLLMDLFCLLCLTLVYPFVRVLIFHNFFFFKKMKISFPCICRFSICNLDQNQKIFSYLMIINTAIYDQV